MIVDRGHRDLVDPLGLERRLADDEPRQVVLVAGRREGARQAEQDHGLAGEIILRLDRLRPVGSHLAHGDVGQAFADFDGHRKVPGIDGSGVEAAAEH